MENSAKSNVNIQLPVKIDYRVLDAYLQKKFTGKILSKGKAGGESTDHARIRKISLRRSESEAFDLALHLELTLLTKVFRNREINVIVHLDVEFREKEQEIYIHHYELEGGNNWFTNKLLEVLINSIAYSRLKDKMKVGLEKMIAEKLEAFNTRLSENIEVHTGIWLSGTLSDFKIKEIVPGMDHLLISLDISGNNILEVKEINF